MPHVLVIVKLPTEQRGEHFFNGTLDLLSSPLQHRSLFQWCCVWLYANNCFNIYLPSSLMYNRKQLNTLLFLNPPMEL